jgi:uncharacterized linocin/CFP29 family protein
MDTAELDWTDQIWKDINDDLLKEIGKVRIAQKVFTASILADDPTQVANEVIDFSNMTLSEGETKPFVEIYREFSLTSTQVKQEADQQVCRTLARMAAKELGLGEDAYFFQLSDLKAKRGAGGKVPILSNPAIHADNWRTSIDVGLLGEANDAAADDANPEKPPEPIKVPKLAAAQAAIDAAGAGANVIPSPTYGENTFKAVTDGIAKLTAKAQAPAYALFLPTEVYADTFIPPSAASLVTTSDRVKPLVDGGFYSSVVLPPDEGLLVALGGEPVKLFVGREATTEYVRKEGARHFFRVVERVQYVVRDPRALVLLMFR